MQLREATTSDIPAIVELLKSSLGESMIPKSESLWKWKHLSNPFGPSPVWLAEEKGNLAGVRAFMQWEWQKGNQPIKALRAVDTATHPDYQGKGIFKQLSLGLIKECSPKGYQFIFNTPNKNSLPGYLKMGWQKKGRLSVRTTILRPFHLLKGLKNKESSPISLGLQKWPEEISLPEYNPPLFATNLSPSFLYWRYAQNPLFKYGCLTDQESYLCIFRIKSHTWAQELRISELIGLQKNQQINSLHLKKQLKELIATYPVDFIAYSGSALQQFPSLGILSNIKTSLGPLITLRNLNVAEDDFDQLLKNELSFSLGDLELF
ncbi:hypothetical protein GCM10028791_40750 [Echinicola sediminis]